MINDTMSMDRKGAPRRKRFSPRTRTGCVTCRYVTRPSARFAAISLPLLTILTLSFCSFSTRRIKCDEAKPACQRCIDASRPCEGYRLPGQPSIANSLPGDHDLLTALGARPTAGELALSEYFAAQVGAHAGDEFAKLFWDHDVGQVCRSVPAIWHASHALAAATWSRSPRARLTAQAAAVLDQESCRQYSAAVGHILELTSTAERPSPRTQTTVLLANILLATHAIGLGEKTGFASIYAASRRLIRQWRFWECLDMPSLSTLATRILYIYIKTERVAQEFDPDLVGADTNLPPDESPLRWQEAISYLQRRPMTCAMRACLELGMIWNSVQDILDTLPFSPDTSAITEAYTSRHELYQLFQSWESRYTSFSALFPSSSSSAKVNIDTAALDVRRILVTTLFRIPIASFRPFWSETCWDPFEAAFGAAVALLERALPGIQDAAPSVASLCASCQFIIHKCRAPALRRRAVAILRGVRDAAFGHAASSAGLWHLPLVVDEVMLAEEMACSDGAGSECAQEAQCVLGSYICNMHRVAKVHVNRAVQGEPEVTLRTISDVLHGRPGYQQIMNMSLD